MSVPPSPPAEAPRLLDRVRQAALAHFGQPEFGDRCADWTRRFVLFHNKQHPQDLGADAVRRFLEHVAQTLPQPLPALEQGHEALTFLYHVVLGRTDLGELPFPEPPRLLDRLRRALRVRQYSPRTEHCYVEWARRFIHFNALRHPTTNGGGPEIERFRTEVLPAPHSRPHEVLANYLAGTRTRAIDRWCVPGRTR